MLEEIKRVKAEIVELENAEANAYRAAKATEPETPEYFQAWQDHRDAQMLLQRAYSELDDLQDEHDSQDVLDPQSRRWVKISAGSNYGRRYCHYEIISDILVLRDEGSHDNLGGNGLATEFQGLTLAEAKDKAEAENSEPRCGTYDGCHWCNWSIHIEEVSQVPRWLTYEEPAKKEIVEAAISVYNKEPGCMKRLKAAIRGMGEV